MRIEFFEEIYSGKKSFSWKEDDYLVNNLPAEAVKLQPLNQFQWKDACNDKSLQSLSKLLKYRNVIYIGSSRTRRFAKSIGVTKDSHICIPNKETYEHIDSITQRIIKRLRDERKDAIVIAHTSSIVGANICLSLAERNIKVTGIDLGLIGSIYDYEYLSSRPWFKARGLNIIKYTEKCSKKQASKIYSLIIKFGDCCKSAISNLESRPQYSISLLENFIENQKNYSFPIASAALLIWKYKYLNKIDKALLKKNISEPNHYECWIAASMIYELTNKREKAMKLLAKANRMCTYEQITKNCMKLLEENQSTDLSSWESVLHQDGRQDFGSQLTWTIMGDIPSNKF